MYINILIYYNHVNVLFLIAECKTTWRPVDIYVNILLHFITLTLVIIIQDVHVRLGMNVHIFLLKITTSKIGDDR